MGTNKRRFLLVEKAPRSNYSEETRMIIPVDSIETINWVKNGNVAIYYKTGGGLDIVNVKQSFADIINGEYTVEL